MSRAAPQLLHLTLKFVKEGKAVLDSLVMDMLSHLSDALHLTKHQSAHQPALGCIAGDAAGFGAPGASSG